MLEIAFRPDRRVATPLARQLATYLASLIDTGRLAVGDRLPPTRDVATMLGLGRNTVNAAYAELTGRGVLISHVGRGTFVAPPRARTEEAAAAPTVMPRAFGWPGLFSRAAQRMELPAAFRRPAPVPPPPFDFRGGSVDTASLPTALLRSAVRRVLDRPSLRAALARPHDPRGWLPLRREIAHLLAARGIACTADDVLIVSGMQQAMQLVAEILVDPGDAVAIEQPGYFGATLALEARGAEILPVEVDADGLSTDRLARLLRLRRVKLVYCTPAAQSPTGARLSPARRTALAALADEYQVPVFEDDCDSELRWHDTTLPALKACDPAGQIVYAGTFSKSLFPGLRLGYVVAARPLLQRLAVAHAVADLGSSLLAQAVVATLLSTHGLEPHVRRVRRLVQSRRDALLAALARDMPEGVTWTTPTGGHLVWLTLPPDIDGDRLLDAAERAGVTYTPGGLFYADGHDTAHLALAFTAVDASTIAGGVARLADAMQAVRSPTTARRAARPPSRRSPRLARRSHARR